MEIAYLKDHRQHLKTVAGWLYDEWGHWHPHDEKGHLQFIKQRLNYCRLPTIFVALDRGEPVGTASLIKYDMDTHPQYSPWLASVYVPVDRRREGIGTALVRHAVSEANKMGIPRLYLFTPDMKRFYARLGWKTRKQVEYREQMVDIMIKDLE